MKILLTNEINLISDDDSLCYCSSLDDSEKSEVFKVAEQQKCKQICCRAQWEMAHFIVDIAQKPISVPCEWVYRYF